MRTKPELFKQFNEKLMENAPEGYEPWYFPVSKEGKDPDGLAVSKQAPRSVKTGRGNWKKPWAKLNLHQAIARLEEGGNVGLAAMEDDPLIIIDIDEWHFTQYAPETLIVKSRKRCGIHAFCWKDPSCTKLPLNIPTEMGEIRSSNQYVVASGSYVKTLPEKIMEEPIDEEFKKRIIQDPLLGVYTPEILTDVKIIDFEGLPYFFKEKYDDIKTNDEVIKITDKVNKNLKFGDDCSGIYKMSIRDLFDEKNNLNNNFPHPLHGSDSCKNFSVSGNLGHCWRHTVSLNAIQFLACKSGHYKCEDVGSGHQGTNKSIIHLDDGVHFWAWHEAKKSGITPKSDPIPYKAIRYIAKKYLKFDRESGILTQEEYEKSISIVEDDF